MHFLGFINRARFVRRINAISEIGYENWYYLLQQRLGKSVLVDDQGIIYVVNNREDTWIHRGANSKEEMALADLSDEIYFTIEVMYEESLQGKKISSFLSRSPVEDVVDGENFTFL